MKRGFLLYVNSYFILSCLVVLQVYAVGSYDDIPRLFWVDKEHVPPMSEEELKALAYFNVVSHHDVIYRSGGNRLYERTDDGSYLLLMIVNEELYNDISDNLNEFITQTESNGYTVELWTAEYADAEDLRAELQDFWAENGDFNCFMIGTLPVALSEIGYFEGEGTPYPIDLFFMDLDGEWEDTDEDGYYDNHDDGDGDVEPDISFGRIYAEPLTYHSSTEAELTNNYLEKVMAYCDGEFYDVEQKGLAFVDDDWFDSADEWGGALYYCYDDVDIIKGADTVDEIYEEKLIEKYETILLCAHSNPNYHAFKIGNDWTGGETWFYEVYNIEPICHFFNLFACSNCQYTYTNCMGSWYILVPSNYGLTSVGSAKTGAMLEFDQFYSWLGVGYNFGDAFRHWFEDVGINNKDWHYGMTLLGNPLLKISEYMNDVEMVVFNASPLNDAIMLEWKVDDEEGITGYYIYRSPATMELCDRTELDVGRGVFEWKRLNDYPITGKSPYSYVDSDVNEGTRYIYRLDALYGENAVSLARTSGSISSSSPLSIVMVYPNPVSEKLHIVIESDIDTEMDISIYDIAGRVVRNESVKMKMLKDDYELSTAELDDGVYIIRASSDSGSDTVRVVVQR